MKKTLTLGILGLALHLAAPAANAQTTLEYPGGPHSGITSSEIQSLKGWSQNAMADITRLLNEIQPMLDASDVKRKLSFGMENIAQNSDTKAADLLLRQAIYAGLTVNRLIEQESIRRGMENAPQGTVDQQVRILKHSLEMAKEYYKSDFAYINGILSKKDTSYVNPKLVEFGVRFSQFLIKMSDGVLDASASYGMIRWSLGILENYLGQDSRNVVYASTIKHLHDELKQYPNIVTGQSAPEDITCIKYVRELKRLAQETYKEIKQTTDNIQMAEPAQSSVQTPTPVRAPAAPMTNAGSWSAPDRASIAACGWFDGATHGIAARGWHRFHIVRNIYISDKYYDNEGAASAYSCYSDVVQQDYYQNAVATAKANECTCKWLDGSGDSHNINPPSRGWHLAYPVAVDKDLKLNVSVRYFDNNGTSSQEACNRELVKRHFQCD